MDNEHREQLKESFRSRFEQSLDERVDRYLSVDHQWITGNHHFAQASSECLELYRDGYFLSAVMVTQAVSEGIVKFVAERNGMAPHENEAKQDLVKRLEQKGVVSPDFSRAFGQIQRSFRNDYHHMNPPVAKIDHQAVSERNIADLAVIEREIFECRAGPDGTVVPKNRLYWDTSADGSVPASVRLW